MWPRTCDRGRVRGGGLPAEAVPFICISLVRLEITACANSYTWMAAGGLRHSQQRYSPHSHDSARVSLPTRTTGVVPVWRHGFSSVAYSRKRPAVSTSHSPQRRTEPCRAVLHTRLLLPASPCPSRPADCVRRSATSLGGDSAAGEGICRGASAAAFCAAPRSEAPGKPEGSAAVRTVITGRARERGGEGMGSEG